jgi:hypothetical protein
VKCLSSLLCLLRYYDAGQQNIFNDVLKYQACFIRKQQILENEMQILIRQFLMSYIYVFFLHPIPYDSSLVFYFTSSVHYLQITHRHSMILTTDYEISLS